MPQIAQQRLSTGPLSQSQYSNTVLGLWYYNFMSDKNPGAAGNYRIMEKQIAAHNGDIASTYRSAAKEGNLSMYMDSIQLNKDVKIILACLLQENGDLEKAQKALSEAKKVK